MRVYLLKKDGLLRNRKTGMLFAVKDGFISWFGGRYHVDPKLFIRRAFRPARFLWLVEREEWAAFFREGYEEPLDMMSSMKPLPAAIAPSTLEAYLKSGVYRRKYSPGLNPWAIVAILLAIGVIIMAGALAGR